MATITITGRAATVKQISGRMASAQMIEDWANAKFEIRTGAHKGHQAEIESGKRDCGAYVLVVRCSCGMSYSPEIEGCWRHRCEEEGDVTLQYVAAACLINV